MNIDINKETQTKAKLHQISHYTPFIQALGFVAYLALEYYKPEYYSSEYISVQKWLPYTFLFITFILNRTYLSLKRGLGTIKPFSQQEIKEYTREYFVKFFPPIAIWTTAILVS